MEVNKIHNINFLDNTLPDKCANLIIADPPYFEVKGAFDFIWEDMHQYLQDVVKWVTECKRLLADNGTLFWYGYAKNIAYTQVILDEYFEFLNFITWVKKDGMQYQYYSVDTARIFTPNNERLLMYENKYNKEDNPFAKYLRTQIEANKIKLGEIQVLYPSKTGGLTGCVSNWVKGDNVMTEEQYLKLQETFTDCFPADYKSLFMDFENWRRPFYNHLKLSDCMEFSQEGHITKQYDHETKKPETLTRALIQVCSRPNDLVVVPFAGSGTECAMAVKEGRKTIGFEITEKHAKMSNDRVQNILRQPSLFVGS